MEDAHASARRLEETLARATPTRRRRTPGLPGDEAALAAGHRRVPAPRRGGDPPRRPGPRLPPDEWPADFSPATSAAPPGDGGAAARAARRWCSSSTDVDGLWKFGAGPGPGDPRHRRPTWPGGWSAAAAGGADLRHRRPAGAGTVALTRRSGRRMEMSAMSYTGKVHPGGPPRRPRAAEADDHQVLGERDGQQRLPAALPADRRPGARRRRRRRPARILEHGRRRRAAHRWSPPTSTGTTTAPWPRWSRPPARETVAGAEDADELPVPVDRRVGDGDVVRVGDCQLEVIRLTGHTPGSIALLYDDPDGTPHLFTGDSLFPGGRRQDADPADLHVADGRRGDQGVRPAARRDLVLPRPRRRLDPGRASARTSRSGARAAGRSPLPASTASHSRYAGRRGTGGPSVSGSGLSSRSRVSWRCCSAIGRTAARAPVTAMHTPAAGSSRARHGSGPALSRRRRGWMPDGADGIGRCARQGAGKPGKPGRKPGKAAK